MLLLCVLATLIVTLLCSVLSYAVQVPTDDRARLSGVRETGNRGVAFSKAWDDAIIMMAFHHHDGIT